MAGMTMHLPIDTDAIAPVCQRHGIRRLSLFGSILRADFDPGRSDVDVLVQFTPQADAALTYFKLATVQGDLEEVLGRPVDLSLANALDPLLRDRILATAEVCYDAA